MSTLAFNAYFKGFPKCLSINGSEGEVEPARYLTPKKKKKKDVAFLLRLVPNVHRQ